MPFIFTAVKPQRSPLLGGRGGVGRPVAADPGINPHPLAHRTAKKLVDRLAQGLALDVPQRLVDAGDGAHVHAAAAVEAAPVQHGPVILDGRRVFADQVVGQLLHHRRHGVGPAFEHRLSPAADARIRVDLQEQPARWNKESGEAVIFIDSPRPAV